MGRTTNSTTQNVYKWFCMYYDKDKNDMKYGVFYSISHLNEVLGLNISNDMAYRLTSHYRVDETKNRKNSVLNKYSNLKLIKININRDELYHYNSFLDVMNIKNDNNLYTQMNITPLIKSN